MNPPRSYAWIGVLSAVALTVVSMPARPADPPERDAAPAAADVRRSLYVVAGEMIDRDQLARPDGHVYAIEVALLVLAAALADDRSRYTRLTDLTRRHFLAYPAGGPAAPVVLWRRRLRPTPSAPDASGTTEALQLAQALLVGADTFKRPADATLAGKILDGYLGHAAEVDGVWIVRNYYNLGTRSFATNSYLIDYSPDLLTFAATRTGANGANLRAAVSRSVALVRKAQRPNGLIDTIIQPELRTLFPFVIFSPNDVIELEHTALVAEQVVTSAPDVARGALRFAAERLDTLHAAYEGRSGRPFGKDLADAGTRSALMRLAIKLGDGQMVERLRPSLSEHGAWLTRQAGNVDVHVVAQTLTALLLLQVRDEGRHLPRALPSRIANR
jgi:hypothetical protein